MAIAYLASSLSRNIRLFLPTLLLFAFLLFSKPAQAADITINSTVPEVNGTTGDDDITIDSGGMVQGSVYGDGNDSTVGGNDSISNLGNVTGDINGELGDDTITNSGMVSAIHGDEGNDSISNSNLGHVTGYLYGELGNDTITNSGTATSIQGNGGNDNIHNSGTLNGVLDGGADNDLIRNSGAIYSAILGGEGDDTILMDAGSQANGIDAGNGDNSITNNGSIYGAVLSGTGMDTIVNNSSITGSIQSGDGADSVTNSGTAYSIETGDGNDFINNTGTANALLGGSGDDTITSSSDTSTYFQGNGGHDSLTNSGKASSITGDDGNDTIVNQATGVVSIDIAGGENDDSITNYGSVMTIYGNAGNDTIANMSSGTANILSGGLGNDSLINNSTNAPQGLYGEEGNDTIFNDGTVQILSGGDDNDSITNQGTVSSSITGGLGDDTISNSGTTTDIYGDQGNDVISNTGSVSHIYGGIGDDSITSDNASTDAYIYGDDGNDTISSSGQGGDLLGGADNDSITNNGTAYDVEGGTGDDTIINNGTADSIDGGSGSNSITNSLSARVLLDISGGDDTDTISNIGTVRDIYGNGSADIITNSGTANEIHGGDGMDVITNSGTVTGISGDDGNDSISNTGTAQQILGGGGNDTILHNSSVACLLNGEDGADSITVAESATAGNITAGADDDTVNLYGTAAYLDGGTGSDILNIGSAAAITSGLEGFEQITTQRAFSIDTLDLTGLLAMEVLMPEAASPITINTAFTAPSGATLTVTITGGDWSDQLVVDVFSTGATGGFSTESIIEDFALFDFTIANAQVTASKIATFTDIVVGQPQSVKKIAKLFTPYQGTSPGGGLGEVVAKLETLSTAKLIEAFKQMTMLGLNATKLEVMQNNNTATLNRIREILSAQSNENLASALALTGMDLPRSEQQQRAQALETLQYVNALATMISGTENELGLHADRALDHNPDLAFNTMAGLDVHLPSAGDIGPTLDYSLGNALGVWSTILGSVTQQEDKEGSFGYDIWNYGVSAGLDYRFSDSFLAGVYGSWMHSELLVDDPGDSTGSGDSWQVGLYAAYAVGDWFISGTGGYSIGTWHSDRRIDLGGLEYSAESDQLSSGFTLAATTGYEFHLGELGITPVAGIEYSYNHQFGYEEDGGGPLSLTVDDSDRHSLRTMAGVEMSYSIALDDDASTTLTPAVKAQWLHEFMGQGTMNARMAEVGSFSVDTPDPDRDTARMGVSLTLASDSGLSGFVAYESDLGETATSHAIGIGLRFEF